MRVYQATITVSGDKLMPLIEALSRVVTSIEVKELYERKENAPVKELSPAKPKQTRNRESRLGNLILDLTAGQPMLPSEMHPHIERDGTFKKSSIAGTLMQMVRHGKLRKLDDGRYTSA